MHGCMHLLEVLFRTVDSGVRVRHDGEDGQRPGGDDDRPNLPGFDPPRIDEEELEVAAFSQHPRVSREHEIVLHHV